MKVFIASSREDEKLAKTIAGWVLDAKVDVKVWSELGVFKPGNYNYEELLRVPKEYQAAIVVMVNEDKVWYRGVEKSVPRDNILVEFGLFSGAFGLNKTLIVVDGKKVFTGITDLQGLIPIDIANRFSGEESIQTWCEDLKKIEKEEYETSDEPCTAEWYVSQQDANVVKGIEVEPKDPIYKDTSDLFFAFLCVNACEKSRLTIGALMGQVGDDVFIEAKYDLMGSWDLLVKFRAKSNEVANKFYDAIVNELIKEGQVDPITQEGTNTYEKRTLINVLAQSKNLANLIRPAGELTEGMVRKLKEDKITYTLLNGNSSYDKYRADRAFIVIEAEGKHKAGFKPGEKPWEAFLNALNTKLAEGVGKEIVESICASEDKLIIETFSSCIKSNHINILNREMQDLLGIHHCQKYSLLCYYYEESGMLKNATAMRTAI